MKELPGGFYFHITNNYSLSTSYVPGPVLDIGNTVALGQIKSCLLEHTLQRQQLWFKIKQGPTRWLSG